MVRNHFLFEMTEEVIDRFIPMGIIQHSYEFHVWMHDRPGYPEKISNLKILGLEDLSFGFNIWIVTCTISVFGFLCEFLIYKMKKLMDFLIGPLFFIRSVYMRLELHLA